MPRGGTLSSLGSSFEELIQGANQSREAVAELRGELNNVQRETTRNAQAMAAIIDSLTGGMTEIRQEIEKVVAGINALSSATSQNRRVVEQETNDINKMWEAYKKMGIAVEKLEVDMNSLIFSEKEINKVVQLGNQYNNARSDSYTALSQKYRAVKILIDQMTVSERENTETGRQLVAQAREWYQQMNLLQQRTGKYQLQVGDYSKALTGLNIATNQVVRELPVLANGVSMFAIAISNNIPILMDNIKAMRSDIAARKAMRAELEAQAVELEALGNVAAAEAKRTSASAIKITSVGKALASTIFSWQTALVLVLTVLPGLIRAIDKKKKAQEEANRVTKEAIEYEKELGEAYRTKAKEIGDDIAKLDSLYRMSNDLNRSMEDRIKIAEAMKLEYKDEFANFTAEEIALGKASTAYNTLRDAIIEVAKARAYQNKITEYTSQQLELKILQDQAKQAKENAEAEITRLQGLQSTSPLSQFRGMAQPTAGFAEAQTESDIIKAKKARDDANKTINETNQQMQELDNLVKKLEDDMPANGILGALVNGPSGKSGGNGVDVPDYYWDLLQRTAEAIENESERELAILEAGWLRQEHEYLENINKLNEMRKGANAEERQQIDEQITFLLALRKRGEEDYNKAVKDYINKRIESYDNSIVEEEDIDAEYIRSLQRRLNEEKVLRTEAAYIAYEQSARTAKDKEALDDALRASERQYWEEYLADLRKNGLLTIQEYNEIMAKLAAATKNYEESGSRGRKGRRYGGIAEALLSQTETFGDTNKFGNRVIKEEYQDFVSAVDNALKTSMKYMDEWMDKRLEMAKVAVDAAQKEVDAARTLLEYELEARANGYANKVETAQKEFELARKNHAKALEEQRRVQNQQLVLDSISQASSLITATANIWEAMTKGTGLIGPILAAAATAALWGSFAASKVKAAQLTKMKSEQYGEGTVELLEGGSHASGHDIDLGTKKDGTRRRAEGGEFFAVINKRSSRKYRDVIPDVIRSFNDGTFGEKYYNANSAMGEFALGLLAGSSPTDVSRLEKDVNAIRRQGDERRYVDSMGNTIIRYKNMTRKINRS